MAAADHGFTGDWGHLGDDAVFEPIRTLPATIIQVAVVVSASQVLLAAPLHPLPPAASCSRGSREPADCPFEWHCRR